jgi:ferric-dicitrate binding protein FerR (iron transport regulator)
MDEDELVGRAVRRSAAVQPPAAARDAARTAVEAAWRESQASRTAEHSVRPRRRALAAGIALLVAGTAGFIAWQVSGPEPALARVANGSIGTYAGTIAAGGQFKTSGSLTASVAQGATLAVLPELSLRLSPGARAHWEGPRTLHLEAGRVLLAAGAAAPVDFAIATPYGTARHIGTQFIVAVDDSGMVIAVREGRARLSRNGQAVADVPAGQVLRRPLSGPDVRESLSDAPKYFSWLGRLPVGVAIEGRPLARFLDWYASETGLRLSYADDSTRAAAESTRLSGSVATLNADEALQALTASADLQASQQNGEIIIARTIAP